MYIRLESFMAVTIVLLANEGFATNLLLGGGVDVFKFFGDLTLAMRVDPRNDSDRSWLLRDISPPLFEQTSTYKRSNFGADFEGNFQIDLCDDLHDLFMAFFRDIRIEGMSKSVQAFTRSWTGPVVRDKLGVPEKYQGKEYSYALVRVSHYSESVALGRHKQLHKQAQVHAESVLIGDRASVLSFMHKFGSHYVSSYVVGDSLFQVIIFLRESYQHLKYKVATSDLDWSTVSAEAVYEGPVLSQSGEPGLAVWARAMLQGQNLLSLQNRPHLLHQLHSRLTPAVLLKLRLRLLDTAFTSDPARRHWFHEVIVNQLRLYELNT